MYKCTFLILAIALLLSCKKQEEEVVACGNFPTDEELVFQSNFESGVTGSPANSITELHGSDAILGYANNWDSLESHPQVGTFDFYYQGGDATERFARLDPDPTNAQNITLHYNVTIPNVWENGVRTRGRVMSRFADNTGMTEVYQKLKIYLSPDFDALKQWDSTFTWLMVQEFWNQANFGAHLNDPHAFRIKIDIAKPDSAPGTDLYFAVVAQDMTNFGVVWGVGATHFPIPTGKWMTMETYVKEGDAQNGRFYMAVTPDGGQKVVICDTTGYTHHPNDSNPDGFAHIQTFKLYTSRELVYYMFSQNKTLDIYYDDWEFWLNKEPK